MGHLHERGDRRRLVPLRLHPDLDREPQLHPHGRRPLHLRGPLPGAKVVTVSPDFSASAVHADRWLNVRLGTDAALALGMAHVIVDEALYDAAYVKEQTDLPFLVRDDNGRFLRESDVVEDGADDRFYIWNAARNRRQLAKGTWGSEDRTLELDPDEDPALEGSHSVKLLDGSRVRVRPVFERLRERVAEYTPERVAEITGVHGDNVRRVARELAAAKSAMIYSSWGACKHYHSDLFQRGMAYVMALTGNTGGKPGSGLKVSTWWPMPGFVISGDAGELRTEPPEELPIDHIEMTTASKMMFDMTPLMRSTPLIPWLYAHDPKWREVASRDAYADPALPRPVTEYMDEVLGNRWQPVWPRPPKRPRFLYYSGPNPLRRWPNPQTIRDSLWKSIDTIVTCDFRLSTSGMWSDYVLPSAGYYEKPGIKYVQSYLPYVVVGDRAVPPLYESKHEFDVVLLLARTLQERARERGVTTFLDSNGVERNLADVYDQLSAGGVYTPGEEGEVAALDYIMRYAPITKASDLGEEPWSKAVEAGMVKIEEIPQIQMAVGLNSVMSDYDPSRPTNQFGWFHHEKMPWPTLTGRQQFYVDHEWFLEVGEELCVHKEPVAAGGPYPLRLNGGHNRWSQHAIMRANQHLLRLQRGGPEAFVSPVDARARGIDDNDWIRVFNDVGEFVLRAKVAPSVQPGEVICYHAWEGFQFPDGNTQNNVAASPLKPNNMVGEYGHLQYRGAYMSMNHVPKEIAIEIEKVREAL
ncbi:MAG: molybdopterin-dependent oxidoreductase [Acidimicrobiia bacterium]|nr:molybdopterin-dependent oxidoreductase [Acidimicrobiia bacterium]